MAAPAIIGVVGGHFCCLDRAVARLGASVPRRRLPDDVTVVDKWMAELELHSDGHLDHRWEVELSGRSAGRSSTALRRLGQLRGSLRNRCLSTLAADRERSPKTGAP